MLGPFSYILFAIIVLLFLAAQFLPLPPGARVGFFVAALFSVAVMLLREWWQSFATGLIHIRGGKFSRDADPKLFQIGRWLTFGIAICILAVVGWILTQLI